MEIFISDITRLMSSASSEISFDIFVRTALLFYFSLKTVLSNLFAISFASSTWSSSYFTVYSVCSRTFIIFCSKGFSLFSISACNYSLSSYSWSLFMFLLLSFYYFPYYFYFSYFSAWSSSIWAYIYVNFYSYEVNLAYNCSSFSFIIF